VIQINNMGSNGNSNVRVVQGDTSPFKIGPSNVNSGVFTKQPNTSNKDLLMKSG